MKGLWRRLRHPEPEMPPEAASAQKEAVQALQEATARRMEVDKVVDRLEAMRESNHFLHTIQRILRQAG